MYGIEIESNYTHKPARKYGYRNPTNSLKPYTSRRVCASNIILKQYKCDTNL